MCGVQDCVEDLQEMRHNGVMVSNDDGFETQETSAIQQLLHLANLNFEFEHGPDNRAPRVAFGLFMSLAHQVHALMLLREADADHACSPLRRSLIEHAAFLALLADKGDSAVDLLNRGLQHTQGKLKRAVDAAAISYDEGAQVIIDRTLTEQLPEAQTHLLHVANLVEKYFGRNTVALWMAESGLAHPSLHVAGLFVDESEDGQLTVSKQPLRDFSKETLALCLDSIFHGALAFNSLLISPVFEPVLREVAEEFDLSMTVPGESKDGN